MMEYKQTFSWQGHKTALIDCLLPLTKDLLYFTPSQQPVFNYLKIFDISNFVYFVF